MRKIIDGKLYDTATATEICDMSPNGISRGDFHYHSTSLYMTKRGTYFIAGAGGPLSRWGERSSQGVHTGGDGVLIVEKDEARSICEDYGSVEEFVTYFGEPQEG